VLVYVVSTLPCYPLTALSRILGVLVECLGLSSVSSSSYLTHVVMHRYIAGKPIHKEANDGNPCQVQLKRRETQCAPTTYGYRTIHTPLVRVATRGGPTTTTSWLYSS